MLLINLKEKLTLYTPLGWIERSDIEIVQIISIFFIKLSTKTYLTCF